jgi:curved DNA-binding protein CbpA
MEDYYSILGVSSSASESEIKSAFRALVKQCHPDSQLARENPEEAEKVFLKIQEAYEALSDSNRRAEYERVRMKKKEKPLGARSPRERARIFYLDGREAYKQERFDRASGCFRYAMEIEPSNPLYCSWLGLSLSKQKGSLHEAKKWCEKAVALSPSNTDYLVNLSIVYREAGLKSLSQKYIDRAISIDPSDKRALLWAEKMKVKEESLLGKIRSFFRPGTKARG